jgi:hypothetical protein
MCTPNMRYTNHKFILNKGLTRFHQKFDQLPKLSLRGQFGGVASLEKSKRLTVATRKRELLFIHFPRVLGCLAGPLRLFLHIHIHGCFGVP